MAKGKINSAPPKDDFEDDEPKKPSKKKECEYVSEFVGDRIGYHRDTTKIVSHHLWDSYYRCNVWAKTGSRNYISHSFFLMLNGEQVVGEISKAQYKCGLEDRSD